MYVKVKKLHEDAILPIFGTMDAACFDIFSDQEGYVKHGDCKAVGTGISMEVPKGYALMLYSRSGHAFKHEVRLANCVGVIDSDYRGEIKVLLAADDPDTPYEYKVGDRIAQGMIIPIPVVSFVETDTLSDTTRGTGGFGSTGA